MSFDLEALRKAVARQGRVARVVIAGVAGSSPREVGAAMLVWPCGQAGTVGGGALEWQAVQAALALLTGGARVRLERTALGPGLGQCCGGVVTLLTEVWDAGALAGLGDPVIRPVTAAAGEMPLALRRLTARARAEGVRPAPKLVAGWMVEPVSRAERLLWVWGAGHVGRALVGVLAPLPDFAITWVDVDRARFPEVIPDRVTPLWAANPADLVTHAPVSAAHLVLTYSHALDLDLCHRLLGHGFASLGLIGSATKAARFRARLRGLGHAGAAIARIESPIGEPALGKHPQAIAVGVAAALLQPALPAISARERAS